MDGQTETIMMTLRLTLVMCCESLPVHFLVKGWQRLPES